MCVGKKSVLDGGLRWENSFFKELGIIQNLTAVWAQAHLLALLLSNK